MKPGDAPGSGPAPAPAARPQAPGSPGGARKLLRDYAALSLGELLAKGAGLLAFAYLARVLGPGAYGAVELAVALAMLFGLVVDFGLGPIGAREVTREAVRAGALARAIPGARLLLAALAAPALLGGTWLLDVPTETRRLIALFAVSLLALPWTLNWLLQGLDRMQWVAPAQALRMVAFGLGVVLLVRRPEHLWRVGVVEVAAAALMAAYFLGAARRCGVSTGLPLLSLRRGTLVRLLREATPLAASQLLWALNQYLPVLLVAALASEDALAFFGGANRIVLSLGSFVWLYFFNLYPSIVRATGRAEAGFAEASIPSFRATAWLGVLAALLGTLLAGPLCRLAYGDAFAPAAAPFGILIWALPIHLLSGHARFGLIAAGRQRRELVAQAAGVAVTAGAGLLLVPHLGGVGAALATLASAAVVWIAAQRLARDPVGRLPFLAPLLRPLAAAGGAFALFAALPDVSTWWRAAAAVALYCAAAPLLEPRLLRDLRALRAGRARTPRPGS